MSVLPNAAMYRWTYRDVEQAKAGVVDDIAAAVQTLVADLCEKLTENTGFSGRCSQFTRDVLEKRLTNSPDYAVKRGKIVAVLANVARVLQETETPGSFSDKVLEILKRVSDTPVTNVSDVKEATGLGWLLALTGTQAKFGLTAGQIASTSLSIVSARFGNLAGPANAYIAWVQWRAWDRAQECFKSGKANPADVTKYLDETMALLERGLSPKNGLKAKLTQAFHSGDPRELDAIKMPLLDEFGGTFQARPGEKAGALALQVLAIFLAYSTFLKDEQDSKKPGASKALVIVDVLNLVSQGEMLVIGAIDVFAMFFEMDKLARTIVLVGMKFGLITSFLGLAASMIQMATAPDKLGFGLAAAGGLGNLSLVIAATYWLLGTPVPQLQAAGVGILLAATLVSTIQVVWEDSKSKSSRLALAVIDAIESSPSYLALMSDQSFKDGMTTLKRGCGEHLPSPRNNQFVRDALLGVGFRSEDIERIVEGVGGTLLPAGSLLP